MERKAVKSTILAVLLVTIMTLTFGIRPVKAEISEPPATEWSKTYGGTSDDHALSVVQTGDGGYAIAGSTNSYGAGDYDFWLVKTDSTGTMQWNKTYGGTSSDIAHSVVQTGDGGYAIAGSTGTFPDEDFLWVKTDSAGTLQWSGTYDGGNRDYAYSVVQTGDGGYAIAGFTGTYGDEDFSLVKTDSAGNVLWSKTYGGTGEDIAYSVVQTGDGGYAIAGSTNSYGSGGTDLWLVKTDSSGDMQWNKNYGGSGNDFAWSVVQTGDGGYAIAGGTASYGVGSQDFWLVKTDSAGNMLWSKTYGGTGNESQPISLVQTGDGGYAIAGSTNSYGAGDYDFWLVKTDLTGTMQWNKTYGGTDQDIAWSLVQTGDGGYTLAGWTTSYGAGSYDAWLIKLAPEVKPTLIITMTNKGSGKTETITRELIDEDHDGLITIEIENRILSAIRRILGATTFDFPGEYTATRGAWTVILSSTNDYTITLT